MLIEDDLTMLTLLGTLLQMEGYQVAKLKSEETLEEVLDSLRAEQPDLALVDIHIRHLSGFDVVRAMRKDSRLRSIRVLMSSGMNVRNESLLAGANGFILKPYMPDDLLKTVRGTLDAK
jgi:DNA-binding response OmpR family regulator